MNYEQQGSIAGKMAKLLSSTRDLQVMRRTSAFRSQWKKR